MVRGFRIEPRPIIELDPDEVGTGPKGLPGRKGPDGDPSTVPGPPGPGLPPGQVGEDEGKLLTFAGPGEYETEYSDFLVGPSIITKSMIGEVDVEGSMVSEVAGGAPSPVVPTVVDHGGNGANSASYNTPPKTFKTLPTLVVVSSAVSSGTAGIPTVTNPELGDFVPIPGGTALGMVSGQGLRRITLLTARPPGSGEYGNQSLQIAYPATQTETEWAILQFSNADDSGVSGAGAILGTPTFASGNGGSIALTMPAFEPGGLNATMGVLVCQPGFTPTPGSGFTTLWHTTTMNPATDASKTYGMFRNDNDVTVDISGTPGFWILAGLEIKRA